MIDFFTQLPLAGIDSLSDAEQKLLSGRFWPIQGIQNMAGFELQAWILSIIVLGDEFSSFS